MMKVIIQEAQRKYGEGCVRVAAPTGCAAVQLPGGRTLHSMLRLPVRNDHGPMEMLNSGELSKIQQDLDGMKLLIIDEKVGI